MRFVFNLMQHISVRLFIKDRSIGIQNPILRDKFLTSNVYGVTVVIFVIAFPILGLFLSFSFYSANKLSKIAALPMVVIYDEFCGNCMIKYEMTSMRNHYKEWRVY